MSFKVYFPSSWGLTAQVLEETYRRLLPQDEEELRIVSTLEDCDYVIVQDSTEDQIPKDKKVVFFQREPEHVHRYTYSGDNLYRSWCHSDGDGWMPQTWWLSLSHKELSDLEYPNKQYRLSFVDSGRAELPGHRNRLSALQDIINHVSDIHAWGKITEGRQNNGIFKTPLPYRAKEKAFLKYKYAMVIENGSTPHYFSEKMIDPMLCWTTPIYWGCSKIDKYFPKGSYIQIKDLKPGIGQEVSTIIQSDFHEQNKEALAEARDLILNKYNLIPTIKEALRGDS